MGGCGHHSAVCDRYASVTWQVDAEARAKEGERRKKEAAERAQLEERLKVWPLHDHYANVVRPLHGPFHSRYMIVNPNACSLYEHSIIVYGRIRQLHCQLSTVTWPFRARYHVPGSISFLLSFFALPWGRR